MIGYFIFDDIDTRDYNGIVVTDVNVDSAPERVYEEITVAGRSGTILMDMKRYDNVVHSYDVVVYDDYVDNLIALRNDLLSKVGYHTLTDSFNTDEKYLATVYTSINPKQKTQRNGGYLHVEFSRKPQRYLISGETAVTPSDYGNPQTETGEIVTIDSDGSLGVKSLEVSLSPIQEGSGEPSPTNIRPISGHTEVVTQRTGKNLLPTRTDGYTNTSNGVTIKFNSDGSITLNGTATATTIWNLISDTASDNRLYLPQGDYILNGESVANNNFWIGAYQSADSGAWSISSKTSAGAFSVGEGDYIFPRIRIGSGVVLNNVTIKPMIRLSSDTDASYEPYNGTTYTTSLGRTVYGGTLDVVSGKLTVDRAYALLNDASKWAVPSGSTVDYRYNETFTRKFYSDSFTGLICSIAQVRSGSGVSYTARWTGAESRFFGIVDRDGLISLDEIKQLASNNEIAICYDIEPQTYQLTPQQIDLLLGTNHLWSDGSITVTYGTHPLYNPTQFESKPLIVVTGKGVLQIGDYVLTIGGTDTQTLYIDCDLQEAWEVVGAGKISRNDYIRNAGEEFPVLMPGINNISVGSGISNVTITPRWWRL